MAKTRSLKSSGNGGRSVRGGARGGSRGAAWKGSLKLSLIRVPIQVFPATSANADVSFHQLHRKCHTRIQLKKWCPHCEVEVSADDIVKGYETSRGRMVVVEEEDIKAVRPESTKTVDISDVVSTSVIDPVYIERSYFLAPDGKAAGSAFGVLRDALGDRAAIGRLALHGREYLVAVLRRNEAMLMHTLRTAGEVRDASSVPNIELARVKASAGEVRLARQVLDNYASGKDLSDFTDHYQEALKQMLASREEEVEPEQDEKDKPAKVVNLMDALRQSLDRAKSAPHGKGRARKIVAHKSSKRRAS